MSYVERETYIILSTGHLTEHTASAIATLPIVSDETDARIRIPLINTELVDTTTLPDELASAIEWVRAHAPDAYGLFFDRDGPINPFLPHFPW